MQTLRFALAASAVSLVLAACGTAVGAPDGSDAPPPEADVTVTAADMAFTETTITVAAAGETFSLALVNDDAMPHNVAIYTDASRSEKLFEGELVTDTTVVYEIPALDAGEYFIDCSLHPNMTGTLVVED